MSGCPVILRILNLCPKDVGRTLLDWTTLLILGLSFFLTSWRIIHLLWQKHSTLRSIVPLLMFDFSMIKKDGMNPTDMSQKQADRSVDPWGSFAVALGT